MKVAQSCLTLCDPMDYAVHGILQPRILKWVAYPFSRGSSQSRLNPGLRHCRRILYQLSYQWIVKERFSELKYKSESDLKETLRVMDM